MLHRAILCLLFVMLVVPVAADGQGAAQGGPVAVAAKSLTWTDLDIPGFTKGMKVATIHGDAAVADAAYTIRLRFPDGYAFPPHYHPKAENLTVLSGTFMLGHGAKAGGQLMTHVPGDFLHIPATRPHYGQVKGETIVQLHGVGPFEVILAK